MLRGVSGGSAGGVCLFLSPRALLGTRGGGAALQRSVTMKLLLALVLALVAAVRVVGTAQVPDKLILDGKEVPLFENPLDSWLEKNPPKPELSYYDFFSNSSNNWRGYQATWKISGDRLLLLEVAKMRSVPKWRAWLSRSDHEFCAVPVEWYMPGKKLPVFAEWYSGRLKIPQGKMTRYVHMGYGSDYERELLIEIKNGVVVARAEISNGGKNVYRSTPDLEWCALGQPVEDQGNWIDVRLFATRRVQDLIKSGEEFRTRGVFFRLENQSVAASLVVFETQRTKADHFPIHKLPADIAVKDGTHVEVTARFVVVDKVPELHVIAIRELQGGESMHAASFPAEWEKLQAEAEKAVETKESAEPAKKD